MSAQSELFNVVSQELARIRTRNPSYSLRAYAKRLGLSVSSLSEALNGKHPFTRKMAVKILERVAVQPGLEDEILSGLSNKTSETEKTLVKGQVLYTQVNMDEFHLISEWYYFGILTLAETQGFRDDPHWVAERLAISSQNAERALDRLERMKLLKRDRHGKRVGTGKNFKTTNGVRNATLRKSHSETLDLARRSIENDALEVCNFSSITMAIDPAKLPQAAKLITAFRRKLCDFLESGPKKEVYKIAIQLFPLTNVKSLSQKGNDSP